MDGSSTKDTAREGRHQTEEDIPEIIQTQSELD